MLPDYLQSFNNTLLEFRKRFPAQAWSEEFKQQLLDDYSFFSSKIEDNSLEYGETIRFLKGELVPKSAIKGKLDVSTHKETLENLIGHYEEFEMTEEDILQVHRHLMNDPTAWEDDFDPANVGAYRHEPVVGFREPYFENKEYAPFYNLQFAMPGHVEFFDRKFKQVDNSTEEQHLITALAYFHNIFLNYLHPFADGNGRTCRIIMAIMMMKNNCPPVFAEILTAGEMHEYIRTIIACEQEKSDHPFAEFLAKGMTAYMDKQLAADARR